MSELRKRSRVPAQFEATLIVGSLTVPVVTRNVSLKGMLCDPEPRAPGTAPCQLELHLSPEVKLAVQAQIVRNDEIGLAIDFTGMDEETFFHLRNIVRFSAEDADSIDQEMTVPAFESK